MATYEYVCLACERTFEDRRSMTSAVRIAMACPACGSERTRRRYSVFATGVDRGADPGFGPGPTGGGCACGGACSCGH